MWPLSGLCTPDRTLIMVLLPAPLSPSRQCTSPGRTVIDMSFSAMTLPKYLLMLRTSSATSAMSARLRSALAHEVVEDDGDQQHDAKEYPEPVSIDACEKYALLNHAEYERSEHRSDCRAIATGEQAAADDGSDDCLELLQLTAQHIG